MNSIGNELVFVINRLLQKSRKQTADGTGITRDYQTLTHPLFRPPAFLGEKRFDVNYPVKLWGAKGTFFVQVKSTEKPLTSKFIEVRLTQKHRKRMPELPGPTYLVGVHDQSKRCFIRSVDK